MQAPRTTANQDIRTKILNLYAKSDKRLGAHKMRQRLEVEYGITISAGRVYRLMRGMQLPKMSTVKTKTCSQPVDDGIACKNLLEQRFNPDSPNRIWVSDITYIRVGRKFCYVCVVIDLFARKVIAYGVSHNIDTRLVADTVDAAYRERGNPDAVMFHSDRGSQYTSEDFRKFLDDRNFIQSFSAKAYPYDNAVAESFFKYLKREETGRRVFCSMSELKLALFRYIEGYYNPRRPHSANGNLSPDEKEAIYFAERTK